MDREFVPALVRVFVSEVVRSWLPVLAVCGVAVALGRQVHWGMVWVLMVVIVVASAFAAPGLRRSRSIRVSGEDVEGPGVFGHGRGLVADIDVTRTDRWRWTGTVTGVVRVYFSSGGALLINWPMFSRSQRDEILDLLIASDGALAYAVRSIPLFDRRP